MTDDIIKCSVCGAAKQEMFACDETEEFYCDEHWKEVRCEELHGEGCATFVSQEIEPCEDTCQRRKEWWHNRSNQCKVCGHWPRPLCK